MKNSILCVLFLPFAYFASVVNISQNDYIEQWKSKAIESMNNFRIPASITIAQAMLESAYGNSELAIYANNHFGIKCSNWDGDNYYKSDNKNSECFRKYKNAEKSFDDHSLFLKNRERYSFLFNYNITDYKSWAYGLKKAGYATNPNYPELLIDLIEKFELYKLDENKNDRGEVVKKVENKNDIKENFHNMNYNSENIKFIVAKKGDTFYKLCKEFSLSLNQLYSYNDFPQKKYFLEEGDIVYLESKKKKLNKKFIIIKEEINAINLSQKEGIKLKSLMKINDIVFEDAILDKGSKIYLR